MPETQGSKQCSNPSGRKKNACEMPTVHSLFSILGFLMEGGGWIASCTSNHDCVFVVDFVHSRCCPHRKLCFCLVAKATRRRKSWSSAMPVLHFFHFPRARNRPSWCRDIDIADIDADPITSVISLPHLSPHPSYSVHFCVRHVHSRHVVYTQHSWSIDWHLHLHFCISAIVPGPKPPSSFAALASN